MSVPEIELPTISKKTRIDEADAPSVIQSAKFWFEDATVVLQAEAQQFRVHRGVLSENSFFFCRHVQAATAGERTIDRWAPTGSCARDGAGVGGCVDDAL